MTVVLRKIHCTGKKRELWSNKYNRIAMCHDCILCCNMTILCQMPYSRNKGGGGGVCDKTAQEKLWSLSGHWADVCSPHSVFSKKGLTFKWILQQLQSLDARESLWGQRYTVLITTATLVRPQVPKWGFIWVLDQVLQSTVSNNFTQMESGFSFRINRLCSVR